MQTYRRRSIGGGLAINAAAYGVIRSASYAGGGGQLTSIAVNVSPNEPAPIRLKITHLFSCIPS